jgi:hypothetical protein
MEAQRKELCLFLCPYTVGGELHILVGYTTILVRYLVVLRKTGGPSSYGRSFHSSIIDLQLSGSVGGYQLPLFTFNTNIVLFTPRCGVTRDRGCLAFSLAGGNTLENMEIH